MAGVLQSKGLPEINSDILKRIDKLIETACDYSARTVLFPVRHHSPACSFHLKQIIGEYRPDCILIEGPSDANELTDILIRSEAPLAIYCSFSDKKGIISDEKEDYKCYYPFLDCSPELVALRQASMLGIEARFIDLAYCDILKNQAEGKGLRKDDASYNDDYLIARSEYIKTLCERLGMQSFDELWEKYFEISAIEQSTKDFIRGMLTYCVLSREGSSEQELAEEGCLAREMCMAGHICEARKKYNRILVITGGFHTAAIAELIEKDIPFERSSGSSEQLLYPIAYSLEAADMLNGYASGMPAPGFYCKVWNKIKSGISVRETYSQTVLEYTISTARKLRTKGESISAYDEICAYDMALGLAQLRTKTAPGLYELRDSVLSCYVKGEYTVSTNMPMRILSELVSGSEIGTLCNGAPVPPILIDFEERCKKFGLRTNTTISKELTLDIFSSAKHRDMAVFFHRLCFINVPYATCIKGIDLRTGKNKNLVREVWKYRWSAQTHSQLVDCSVSGSTIEEACARILADKLNKAESAENGASLMVSAFEMGLESAQKAIADVLTKLIAADGSFISLANALGQLVRLAERTHLYHVNIDTSLGELINALGCKLTALVASIANVSDDDYKECSDACRLLYRLSSSRLLDSCRDELIEAFERLVSQRPINPSIEGTVHGLLYGSNPKWREDIITASTGYFSGTGEQARKATSYLRGLFSTARDLVLLDGYFIESIDELLSKTDDEQFMLMLAEIRLAFGYFTPSEIDRIAAEAACLHGVSRREITERAIVHPDLYGYAKKLDLWAAAQLEEY